MTRSTYCHPESPTMRLAKPHLDIGLFTNDITSHRVFWSETVGLRLDHELDFGNGTIQHRYDAHDSVIKINHFPDPFEPQAPSGYTGLTIARTGAPAWEGSHPGGEKVRLVPPGTDGIIGIGITVSTPDPARMMDFYLGAMEFEQAGSNIARCGDSLLFVEQGPGGVETDDFVGPNFRYLTVQIFDADEACDQIVARGGRLSRAPVTLGKIARYGFVCDPDGNWIEISARASLTGIIPPPDA
ncbi:MAG: VOC family protein [Gammaproteobacteria bacterium]|nr:VOC family protein [Gammaproteobacteria bacterium]